jgi:PEP-CTERM motif
MFSSKQPVLQMLTFGGMALGMALGGQQAGAVIVFQDDAVTDGGLALGGTEYIAGGASFVTPAMDANDGNQFAIIEQVGQFNGTGLAQHVDIADVTAVQPLVDGMTLRASAWVLSDPNNPWNPLATDGLKIEFYNTALGAFGSLAMTNETENGFGLGLSPVAQAPSTSAWQQQSFTVPITDADVDFASLQEIRPVLFQGDWTGSSPESGRLFVDGFTFEVFPDLATANATALPANMPGGFNPTPPPDLSGDINGDGFVGIGDLNIVLGNWNAGTPPVAPGPDLLSDFSNFNLSGTYVQWDAGTFTSGATDFTVQANDFGGGFFNLAAPLDATGETTLEIKLDVNVGNVAGAFNIVLIDADGTERVFNVSGLTVGDNQTLLVDLIDFVQDNAVGSVPGLDLSAITVFHIQGTFGNGDPGLAMDLTFDNLALIPGGAVLLDGDINGDGFVGIADLNIVLGTWNNGTPPSSAGSTVPEPASLALLGLGGLAVLRRRCA